jgi:hypothetical protein
MYCGRTDLIALAYVKRVFFNTKDVPRSVKVIGVMPSVSTDPGHGAQKGKARRTTGVKPWRRLALSPRADNQETACCYWMYQDIGFDLG